MHRYIPVIFRAGLVLATTASALPSGAVTLVQSFNDSSSFSSFLESATTTTQNVRASPVDFIVQPFQSSLGTLNSVTIQWASSGSGSVTAGTAASNGSLSFFVSGSVYVGADSYSGYGCGGGNGAASGVSFNASTTSPCGKTQVFKLGGPFNPNIWTTLTSTSPYTISFSTTQPSLNSITYTNLASGSVTMANAATVTYDYTPSPAVPAPLPLLGAAASWKWSRRLRRRLRPTSG